MLPDRPCCHSALQRRVPETREDQTSETMGQRVLFATRAEKCAKVGGEVLLGASSPKACERERGWPCCRWYCVFLRVRRARGDSPNQRLLWFLLLTIIFTTPRCDALAIITASRNGSNFTLISHLHLANGTLHTCKFHRMHLLYWSAYLLTEAWPPQGSSTCQRQQLS